MNWTIITIVGMFFAYLSLNEICDTIVAVKTHDPDQKDDEEEEKEKETTEDRLSVIE